MKMDDSGKDLYCWKTDLFSWISMDVEIRNPDGTMADSIEGFNFLRV